MSLFLSPNVIHLRLDTLHILNDIHNNPHYREIGTVITPQGLIAVLMSLSPSPGWNEASLMYLEGLDRTCISKHAHLDELQIFLESIVNEIDSQTHALFQRYGAVTSPHFYSWSGLSCLSLIASTNHAEQNSIQQLSKQRASTFRYYDSYHA